MLCLGSNFPNACFAFYFYYFLITKLVIFWETKILFVELKFDLAISERLSSFFTSFDYLFSEWDISSYLVLLVSGTQPQEIIYFSECIIIS